MGPATFRLVNGKPIPVRVPLAALLSGLLLSPRLYVRVRDPDLSPIQVPSLATHFRHPQVAHSRLFPSFFDEVCPNRTIIDPNEVNRPMGDASTAASWLDKARTDGGSMCVDQGSYTPDFRHLVRFLTLSSLFAQPDLIFSGGVKGIR